MLNYQGEAVVVIRAGKPNYASVKRFTFDAELARWGLVDFLDQFMEHSEYRHPRKMSGIVSRDDLTRIVPYDFGAISSTELLNVIDTHLKAFNCELDHSFRLQMAEEIAPMLTANCFQLDPELFPDVLQVVGIDWNTQNAYLLSMALTSRMLGQTCRQGPHNYTRGRERLDKSK